MDLESRRERCRKANELIEKIASRGREFFTGYKTDEVGELSVNDRGRIYYEDPTSGESIYTHYSYRWMGFSEGGTLKSLIEELRDYVMDREHQIMLGPWPDWTHGWGYPPEDMETIREKADELGINRYTS